MARRRRNSILRKAAYRDLRDPLTYAKKVVREGSPPHSPKMLRAAREWLTVPRHHWNPKPHSAYVIGRGDLVTILSTGKSTMSNRRNRRNRRNGRRYAHSEWLEFLNQEAYAEADPVEAARLQKAYENRIETLLDMAFEESLFEDYPDVQEIAYLSFASQAGHGVGLWEGREPWHEDFEEVVNADAKLGRVYADIEQM